MKIFIYLKSKKLRAPNKIKQKNCKIIYFYDKIVRKNYNEKNGEKRF